MNKKFAFTLAEVLITLGIIGIVASITTPTVLANYQKHTLATKFKKVIFDLDSAIDILLTEENKDVLYYSSIFKSTNGIENFVNNYLEPIAKCENGTGKCFADKYNSGENDNPCASKTAWVLVNSVAICPFKTYGTMLQLYIDVNGVAKPNQKGRDIFTVWYWGEHAPYTADGFIYKANFCGTATGFAVYGAGCLDRLKANNWKMDY